jgi:hypothetical protein
MSLDFRLNACPVCLICIVCNKIYGINCTCLAQKIVWKRKICDREYKVDFRHQPLLQSGATKQRIKLDTNFVSWFQSNISSQLKISLFQPDINICKVCIKKYEKDTKKGNLKISALLYLCTKYLIFFNLECS